MSHKRSPWWYVPTLYFQQGLPVILIQQFSVIMYKKLGVPNDQIGLWTSLVTWPWILKMFWGPLVDSYSSKRRWVQFTQLAVTILLGLSALAIDTENFLPLTLGLFFITAFFSATHDTALDAYYLVALPREEQAYFVGIRSTFFRLAMIFCTGGLVILVGLLEQRGLSIGVCLKIALLVAAFIYGLLMIYARFAAPKLDQDIQAAERPPFIEAFQTFFTQPRIGVILLFILLYRFSESMLSKMSGVFLLDTPEAGGLALSTVQVGVIMGNVGMISLVAGGLLGGFVVSRFGFKRCIWPMVISMHLPNLFYLWASKVKPGSTAVSLVVGVESFAYGFGLAAYLVFLMIISQRSRFQASHYAIATGIMALSAMLAGIASGYIQKALGYPGFFTVVCLMSIPGMLLIPFLPSEEKAKA